MTPVELRHLVPIIPVEPDCRRFVKHDLYAAWFSIEIVLEPPETPEGIL